MTTRGEVLVAAYEYALDRFNQPLFNPGETVIPASGALISPEDVVAMVEASLSGWYTEYKNCAAFKRLLRKALPKNYVTLCNSGSSANLLAVTAALEHFKRGSHIITCATGFPTTVAPIYQNGQVPIYIDIDPVTMQPKIDQALDALRIYGKKVSGIILAHTLGFPYDEKVLLEKGVWDYWLIADCCDALGAEVYHYEQTFKAGELADLATMSFFPAHHITAAEGGAVFSSNKQLYDVVESYSNWGRDCFCAPGQNNTCGKRFDHEWKSGLPAGWDHKYTFTRLGYNLKMTELQAALGLSQIQKVDQFIKARKQNYQFLRMSLNRYSDHLQFVEFPDWSNPSPFGFPITVKEDSPILPFELISYLESHKISTRRVFGGNITKQPGFHDLPYVQMGKLEGSDFVMNNTFWIGIHQQLDERHMNYVLEVFESFFKEKGIA